MWYLIKSLYLKVTVLQGMENMYINKEHFTVVSVDNVDFMHTYARVVKGKQNSSWHGTTVQAVQPLPSLSLCSRLDGQSAPPHKGTGAVLEHELLSLLRLVRLEPLWGLHTHSQLTHRVPHPTEAPERCLSMKRVSLLRLVRLEPLLGLHAHSQLTHRVPPPPHRGTGAVLEHETTQFAPSVETGAPFGPTRPLSAHTNR